MSILETKISRGRGRKGGDRTRSCTNTGLLSSASCLALVVFGRGWGQGSRERRLRGRQRNGGQRSADPRLVLDHGHRKNSSQAPKQIYSPQREAGLWQRVSCSPVGLELAMQLRMNFELLIFLPLPAEFWNYSCASSPPV